MSVTKFEDSQNPTCLFYLNEQLPLGQAVQEIWNDYAQACKRIATPISYGLEPSYAIMGTPNDEFGIEGITYVMRGDQVIEVAIENPAEIGSASFAEILKLSFVDNPYGEIHLVRPLPTNTILCNYMEKALQTNFLLPHAINFTSQIVEQGGITYEVQSDGVITGLLQLRVHKKIVPRGGNMLIHKFITGSREDEVSCIYVPNSPMFFSLEDKKGNTHTIQINLQIGAAFDPKNKKNPISNFVQIEPFGVIPYRLEP